MTKLISVFFATVLAFNAQAANKNVDRNDPRYLQLSKMHMTDVTAQYSNQNRRFEQAGLYENCDPAQKTLVPVISDEPSSGLNPLDSIEIIVDKIINIGKKIWAIMDAGRPVVNVKGATANALPKGLTCWTDLDGWNIPQSKVYRVTYTNGLGADVVDFAYRVTFTAGGSLNGIGKYITNATIMPANMNVSWGFNFNAQAEVPSVFNTATKSNPVAGMQMLMKWSVDSVMTHAEQAETFYVGGDNNFKHLR